SLVDTASGKAYPLRREWLSVERGAPAADTSARAAAPARDASTRGDAAGAGGARWRLLGRTAREEVYENARALPRAWLASEARALGDEATLAVIRTGRLPDGSRWEPLRTALAEQGAEEAATGGGAGGAGAEVFAYEPNRVDVRTKAGAPSLLVLAENHYPGWRAYLDGRAVEVLRVNYALRGVRVPAGEHEVSFRYRPASALAGLAVSLLTAAALLLWWRRRLPEGRLPGFGSRGRRPENQGGSGDE
ncbi:MAG TPA: YfhO family protein, partial [Pyrinomonadaceae bacterium]